MERILTITAALLLLAPTTTLAQRAPEKGPLRVFVLVGQSNMQGKGKIAHLEELATAPETAAEFGHLRAGDAWVELEDVFIKYLERRGKLTVGYGSPADRIGPELGFGHVVGAALKNQVLLIKIAWGGQSLGRDFRPPSAGLPSAERLQQILAQTNANNEKRGRPLVTLDDIKARYGQKYREMIAEVRAVLADIKAVYPDYDGSGFELSGLVWFQGFNDVINNEFRAEYGANMVHFIRDVRKDLGVPKLPIVIGELGMDGVEVNPRWAHKHYALRAAQEAPSKMPEFAGTVAFARTSPLAVRDGKGYDGGYHYRGRADTFYRIGELFGRSMLKMLAPTPIDQAVKAAARHPLAGADESTPSRSHYFSWINNTNEGATEAQTLANLDFFKWLHDEYGMELDIYAFDAGTIDAPRYYGSIYSDRFKEHYPNGLDPIVEKAKSFGCRLGVWLGPDGFGDTPQEERARTDMLVKLCREYDFHLFKVDAVCGQLRTEKQDAFVRLLTECRKYSPDLIVLNHRLNLGHGVPHVTTRLWGGEAYIDVWRSNRMAATHNRACTVAFGVPVDGKTGKLRRLVEDHGVCLSSSLDYWEDDLYLQAFSRNLILAPELYGSPWFLRDDELPKLARIYNLCRRYRDIAVNGQLLPSDAFGPHAVSRGDATTRLAVLRNTTWEPVTYSVPLDETIGLERDGPIDVRRVHVSEEVLGSFAKGDRVDVEVLPFRGCMLIATAVPSQELGVVGCTYEVVRDVPGKPAEIDLLGVPGTTATVSLPRLPRQFSRASLDGKPVAKLLQGGSVEVAFPGEKLTKPWHRKLSDLASVDVPEDAEALYEATCFAADNNALEIRSKFRSGATQIPQVQKARDAFFDQKLLVERGVWDRYLFDDDPDTFFRLRTRAIWGGALRVDLDTPTAIEALVLKRADDRFTPEEAHVSADLRVWRKVPVTARAATPPTATVLRRSYTVSKEWSDINVNDLSIDLSGGPPVRYVRIPGQATNVAEVVGLREGKPVDRTQWRASNAFAAYPNAPARRAWSGRFVLEEAARGSYLVVACIGPHGRDGAYAALRVDGRYVGAPRRAISYPANPWEYGNRRATDGLSYFFPVTEAMVGKEIDAVVLQFDSEDKRRKVELGKLTPQAWITAYPVPYESKRLVLEP